MKYLLNGKSSFVQGVLKKLDNFSKTVFEFTSLKIGNSILSHIEK